MSLEISRIDSPKRGPRDNNTLSVSGPSTNYYSTILLPLCIQSSQNCYNKIKTLVMVNNYTGFVYRDALKNLDSKLVRPSFYEWDLYYYNILNCASIFWFSVILLRW